MVITVFVHPRADGGWRWALHLGSDPTDLSSCCQAWGEASKNEAAEAGSSHAAALCNGLRLCGITAHLLDVKFLDEDPTPGDGIVRVI